MERRRVIEKWIAIQRVSKNESWMEGLILAQGERWRRA